MIKLITKSKSPFYNNHQTKDVIQLALKLAKTDKLRNVLDEGKEISYWYAPEVDKGTSQISSNTNNKYKTVSLRLNKQTKLPLSNASYSHILDELNIIVNSVKTSDLDLFVLLGAARDDTHKWMIAKDGNSRPYTYLTFDKAAAGLNRLVTKLRKNPKDSAYEAIKILKYNIKNEPFDKGLLIDSYLLVTDSSGNYIDENYNTTTNLDDACLFYNNFDGQQLAQITAKKVNGKVNYFETRQIY